MIFQEWSGRQELFGRAQRSRGVAGERFVKAVRLAHELGMLFETVRDVRCVRAGGGKGGKELLRLPLQLLLPLFGSGLLRPELGEGAFRLRQPLRLAGELLLQLEICSVKGVRVSEFSVRSCRLLLGIVRLRGARRIRRGVLFLAGLAARRGERRSLRGLLGAFFLVFHFTSPFSF